MIVRSVIAEISQIRKVIVTKLFYWNCVDFRLLKSKSKLRTKAETICTFRWFFAFTSINDIKRSTSDRIDKLVGNRDAVLINYNGNVSFKLNHCNELYVHRAVHIVNIISLTNVKAVFII